MSVTTTEDLTRDEAQKALRLRKQTMLRLIRSGSFPGAYRVGDRGEYRIPRSDIDAYKRRRRVTT